MYCWSTILVATDVAGRGIDIPDVAQDGGIRGKGTDMVMETNSLHLFNIHFTMKPTYTTLPFEDDIEVLNSEYEIAESGQDVRKIMVRSVSAAKQEGRVGRIKTTTLCCIGVDG
ncbi:Rab3 GTPase-activating protein catalytic subunit isoform X1 [Tanacetum coccineum]